MIKVWAVKWWVCKVHPLTHVKFWFLSPPSKILIWNNVVMQSRRMVFRGSLLWKFLWHIWFLLEMGANMWMSWDHSLGMCRGVCDSGVVSDEISRRGDYVGVAPYTIGIKQRGTKINKGKAKLVRWWVWEPTEEAIYRENFGRPYRVCEKLVWNLESSFVGGVLGRPLYWPYP